MENGLWTRKTRKRFEDETHWAQLTVKEDPDRGASYFDILVGLKGKGWHAHFGININETIRFTEFRGGAHSIARNVESLKYGHIEYKKIIVDPTVSPDKAMVFKTSLDRDTGEVTVEEFKLE
jgi:hypothetical protein